jgi:hypothetical protein
MGLFDALRARRAPAQPDLDALFAVPTAAVTLAAALDAHPTGRGAAVFRAPAGAAFADLQTEIRSLLDADGGPPVAISSDEFSYTWLVVASEPADVSQTVTDLHAVHSSLVAGGFGPQLLCSVVGFAIVGRPLHLVYLAKRGRFYPFAPTGPDSRDQMLEMQVADLLGSDLPLESDRSRWFALWNPPL